MFQGYGLQAESPLSLQERRMKRLNRKKERLTKRTRQGGNANLFIEQVSSQDQTSLTNNQNVSLLVFTKANKSTSIGITSLERRRACILCRGEPELAHTEQARLSELDVNTSLA